MLRPEEGTTVYETSSSVYWFDDNGILCTYTKPNAPTLNDDEASRELEQFFEKHGSQKLCILIDAKHVKPNTKAERERSAEMLPKVTKALAVVVHNALGRMLVNLFVGLQKPPYPLKVFKPGEEEEAKTWLKQYM